MTLQFRITNYIPKQCVRPLWDAIEFRYIACSLEDDMFLYRNESFNEYNPKNKRFDEKKQFFAAKPTDNNMYLFCIP